MQKYKAPLIQIGHMKRFSIFKTSLTSLVTTWFLFMIDTATKTQIEVYKSFNKSSTKF